MTRRHALRSAVRISSARVDEYLRRIALRPLPYRERADAAALMDDINERLAPVEQDGLDADH